MTPQRRADRLGADAAGRVEDARGLFATGALDQRPKRGGLACHGRIPAFEDQVIAGGQRVVHAILCRSASNFRASPLDIILVPESNDQSRLVRYYGQVCVVLGGIRHP